MGVSGYFCPGNRDKLALKSFWFEAMIINSGKIEDFVPLSQIDDYMAEEIIDLPHHVVL